MKDGFNRFIDKHGKLALQLAEEGQHPEYMFVGCMDSRVAPELIFDLKVGDAFGDRPMGALIPPYTQGDLLSEQNNAKLSFAPMKGVKHIFVVGHTECGVAEGLANGLEHTHISPWLAAGKPATEFAKKATSNDGLQRRIERQIPVENLENLQTYPAFKDGMETGEFDITILLYDLKALSLYEYDPEEQTYSLYAGNGPVDLHQNLHQQCAHG